MTGVYEPSAIQQFPDGRFIIVEDEKHQPISLVTIAPDGSIGSTPLKPGLFEADKSFWKLDDLEGVVLDRSGNIYAITSHSRDGHFDSEMAESICGSRRTGTSPSPTGSTARPATSPTEAPSPTSSPSTARWAHAKRAADSGKPFRSI